MATFLEQQAAAAGRASSQGQVATGMSGGGSTAHTANTSASQLLLPNRLNQHSAQQQLLRSTSSCLPLSHTGSLAQEVEREQGARDRDGRDSNQPPPQKVGQGRGQGPAPQQTEQQQPLQPGEEQRQPSVLHGLQLGTAGPSSCPEQDLCIPAPPQGIPRPEAPQDPGENSSSGRFPEMQLGECNAPASSSSSSEGDAGPSPVPCKCKAGAKGAAASATAAHLCSPDGLSGATGISVSSSSSLCGLLQQGSAAGAARGVSEGMQQHEQQQQIAQAIQVQGEYMTSDPHTIGPMQHSRVGSTLSDISTRSSGSSCSEGTQEDGTLTATASGLPDAARAHEAHASGTTMHGTCKQAGLHGQRVQAPSTMEMLMQHPPRLLSPPPLSQYEAPGLNSPAGQLSGNAELVIESTLVAGCGHIGCQQQQPEDQGRPLDVALLGMAALKVAGHQRLATP